MEKEGIKSYRIEKLVKLTKDDTFFDPNGSAFSAISPISEGYFGARVMKADYYPLKIIKEESEKKFGRSSGKPKLKVFIVCPKEGKKVEYRCGYNLCEFWGKSVLGVCFCCHKRASEFSIDKREVEMEDK